MSSPTCLLVADLIHPAVHGVTPESSPGILGHYLAVERYESDEFMEDEHVPFINIVRVATQCERRTREHPYIRAYADVVSRPGYCTLNIGRTEELAGGETIAILKTHWLRVVQRRFRRLLSERAKVTKARAHPSSLIYRESHGVWPSNLRAYPALRGCLSDLKQ